ncbi:cupin domain-containing protein [Paenibacillus glycanilyticus]|uniref:cupin domain-containing protein n=1 Tax=Paenibacillus glycanilyticus TaxID=126569 RepID=UPI00203C547D|nr:cupin domain-containing protein [Paenibacillus glycanilyticus]MCM3630649.1 cupin domain-containing protein [Paenibacillus glycanilyticus]
MTIIQSPLAGHLLSSERSNLVIAEWTAEGCAEGTEPEWIAPLHIHHEDDEAWYVLEGTLGFRIGDQIVEAKAGDCVLAPRGSAHTYWNPKAEPARYLLMMTYRINELIQAIHATSDRSPNSMRTLFKRYQSELA